MASEGRCFRKGLATAALVAALAVTAASPVSAQNSQVEPRVIEALKACSIWVNDNDIAAAKAAADAVGFVIIGPGGSWFQNSQQAVRFAMHGSGTARDCDVYVLPGAAEAQAVVGWARAWMVDAGYVDKDLNGPQHGYLIDARSFVTMSGSLSAATAPNGTTVVTQSTLGY